MRYEWNDGGYLSDEEDGRWNSQKFASYVWMAMALTEEHFGQRLGRRRIECDTIAFMLTQPRQLARGVRCMQRRGLWRTCETKLHLGACGTSERERERGKASARERGRMLFVAILALRMLPGIHTILLVSAGAQVATYARPPTPAPTMTMHHRELGAEQRSPMSLSKCWEREMIATTPSGNS